MEGKHVRQPSKIDTVHDQQTQQMDIRRLDEEDAEVVQGDVLEGPDRRAFQHQQQTQQSNSASERMKGDFMFEGDSPPPSYEQSCNDRQV